MAKILMIDDDPDMVLAVRLCLDGAGYEVFDARNAETGLSRLAEIKPDLIILDVMMDSATEGFQAALKLHSADPDSPYAAYSQVPIVMLTALHSTTDLRFTPDADYLPVDAFLDKPIDPDKLIKTVGDLLVKAH
jgi:CheY-like chemotaxis protein